MRSYKEYWSWAREKAPEGLDIGDLPTTDEDHNDDKDNDKSNESKLDSQDEEEQSYKKVWFTDEEY